MQAPLMSSDTIPGFDPKTGCHHNSAWLFLYDRGWTGFGDFGALPTESAMSTPFFSIKRVSQFRAIPVQAIAEALVAEGYTSLDKQAKALGLGRSTAWTIIKKKHKLGRLNAKTTQSILANPDTPASVRAVIQQYLAQDLVTLPVSIE